MENVFPVLFLKYLLFLPFPFLQSCLQLSMLPPPASPVPPPAPGVCPHQPRILLSSPQALAMLPLASLCVEGFLRRAVSENLVFLSVYMSSVSI